ncbi:MAG: conserved hypothetical rane protein [Betaproteobacteria bacterium]|nr:conserved hypothetical rane protein [Betaproteobacteria bacterium]
MNLEAVELAHVTQEISRPGFRWSSVFAGTCVGIAVYVLAMLVGVCVGLTNGLFDGANVSVGALAWNLMSALGAALLGAFVAARSADLRRAADGAMHGLVVWACAVMLVMLVALVLLRDVAGNAMQLMAQSGERETAMAQLGSNGLRNGMRTTAFAPVRSDTPALARADRGGWLEMSAAPEKTPQAQPRTEMRGIDISAFAALMACAALAISLFGGIAGGLLGTRATRRDDPLDAADWRAVLDDF